VSEARPRDRERDREPGERSQRFERGVSDLIGFATVFGVVVISVALVYTFGVGALADVQRAEATDNAERAFDIVAENMADIHHNGAPGRSTELDFEGGELATTGPVTVTVKNGSGALLASMVATPIRYTDGEEGFYYAGGAVVRTNRDAAVAVRDPPFRVGSDRTVVSLVETKADGETTSIGGGSARVATRRVGSSVAAIETGRVDFEINVTSPRYGAWQRYFESEGLSCSVHAAENTVSCAYTTDELYVRRTIVRVRLTP
jgi:hypothetical protein